MFAASGAVADVRTGGASDPLAAGTTSVDAERVEVSYDSERGRVEALARINPALQYFGGDFELSIAREYRDGRCFAGNPGDPRLENHLVWDIAYGLRMVGRPDVHDYAHVDELLPTTRYVFEHPELVGRDYRCVTDVSLGSDETGVEPSRSSGGRSGRTR